MWRAGADLLAFSTAGAEALRIIANGNAGIGTSSPSSKLQVIGTIAGTSTDSYSHKFNSGTSSSITNEINGTGDAAAKLYWKKNDTDVLMSLDMSGTLDVDGAITADGLTVDGEVVAAGRIKTTNGLFQADEGSQRLRQYEVSSGSGTQSFLLGKIKSSNSADGGVTGCLLYTSPSPRD